MISCLMPTADRRRFVPQAIRCFLAQDYAERELIVLDDGADSIRDLVPDDPRIRYFRGEVKQTVGAKRNWACREARGEVLVHWDDDDWSAPWRLTYQAEQLRTSGADICGLDRVHFYAPSQGKAWEFVYSRSARGWVFGASLCYTRAFWQTHPFPEIAQGEDTSFVWADRRARIHAVPDTRFLVALIHDANTSRHRTGDARYRVKPLAEVEQTLGFDAAFYRPAATPVPRQRALISAALGIGDILRMTPLVRVAHRLGYEVDVLLATDYPEVVALLEGAPEIRRVFHVPSARCGGGASQIEGLSESEYEVATFTTWSATLRERIRARRTLAFERARWLAEGDSRSVECLAREMGWEEPMPAPFAMASRRRFDLPPGTIALHPGCKAEWPWKKWHGFAELAQLFPNVVIVGSEEDARVDGTYFRKAFAWPEHARNFTGQLTLSDTAALLRECAAVVSNDSGLMHLAATLGVPTFGIFGITSPQREGIPVANFHPLHKGLPCAPACHAGTWGRRDCARHLECLKTLTAHEVYMKVLELAPAAAPLAVVPSAPLLEKSTVASPPAAGQAAAVETIDLVYYGYLFDASGYGHAARAYLHALHSAGVNVAAVDLASRARQIEDPLVDALTKRRPEGDFHLFHGIPPQWARRAFPLRNVIAMTVWETDSMPPQWRPTLNHALEVWLPCEFNTAVFGSALMRPVYKLPHPWLPAAGADGSATGGLGGVQEDDFVFYSVFEWQERKGPCETIEAFLRAFPTAAPVVLLLKSNPGAASVAAAALAEIRRRVPSAARVELRCEGWSNEQLAALHARGDCYVSLHRGEGWNCPLFEAVCRGKAIVATGFSGPLEYLDAEAHHLVRHQTAAVRQRYAYYSPGMRWAEPDLAHAEESMRAAFAAGPTDARAAVAERCRLTYSIEAIGRAAHARLLHLLRQTNEPKWLRLTAAARATVADSAEAIPAAWYDADYFEHGLKSNWLRGYTWKEFAGLFRETAEFLATSFPEAHSFLDAGCAKGFLVRTLRERGREVWGFDHSAWALEHAEEAARPWLRLASADDFEIDREVDVLLSFSLLESLTETQALAFLKRARGATRQALVAVISTGENERERAGTAGGDRDLSHRTLRSRAWWHELLQRAGWRQDALHRLVQRSCQSHPLPTRMGWSLFVYAP